MANNKEKLRQNTKKLIRKLSLFQDNLIDTSIDDIKFIGEIIRLEREIDRTLAVMEDLLEVIRTIHINVVDEGEQDIKVVDIIYVEVQNHYAVIHTTYGNIKCKHSMTEIENMLQDEPFYRSHKSYLVNVNEIYSYEGSTLCMSNNEKVYISRRRMTEFKKLFSDQKNRIITLRKLKIT